MLPDNQHDPLSLSTASQLVEDVFGVRFSTYQGDGEWQSTHKCQDSAEAGLSQEELTSVLQSTELSVQQIDDGQQRIIIPIHWYETPTVVIGKVTSSNVEESQRLGRLALRLIRQHAQLQQQTELFEELIQRSEENTWLRSFSELVESCEANHPVHTVASSVLPRLQQLIDARSVCFFPARGKHLTTIGCGKELPKSVSQLLEAYRERTARQPVVLNARTQQEFDELGLSSFILVQVGHNSDCLGWLAAIDRNSSTDNFPLRLESTSEYEFGTVEAGLMQAAAALLGTHASNVELFKSKERLTLAVIQSFVKSIDARDPYTKGHSDRVALYSRSIAQQMNLGPTFCEEIYLTGLLHDVGKIGIPDAVLKKSGTLTDEEYAIIKQHPEIGYNILCELNGLEYALNGVRHHHERPDGRGYPDGLAGKDIPLEARIMSVADAYDAMTSSRAYRKHMPFEKAERIVRDNIGTQFDEEAAHAFFSALPTIHSIANNDHERRVLDIAHSESVLTTDLPSNLLLEIDTASYLVSEV